jgi:hypothetical protein
MQRQQHVWRLRRGRNATVGRECVGGSRPTTADLLAHHPVVQPFPQGSQGVARGGSTPPPAGGEGGRVKGSKTQHGRCREPGGHPTCDMFGIGVKASGVGLACCKFPALAHPSSYSARAVRKKARTAWQCKTHLKNLRWHPPAKCIYCAPPLSHAVCLQTQRNGMLLKPVRCKSGAERGVPTWLFPTLRGL